MKDCSWSRMPESEDVPASLRFALVQRIAGHDGMLIRGRENSWKVIDHKQTKDDIWDLEWFEGELYVSTLHAVYRLRGDRLEPVDFGADPPKSCYQLSSAPGVLWSNGEHDIMSFDGKNWTRIV